MPQLLFTPRKDLVPIVQEAGWAPGLVWTGVENLAPRGFDPWIAQPVASCYTDYATRPTTFCIDFIKTKSEETKFRYLENTFYSVFIILYHIIGLLVPRSCTYCTQ